MRARRVPDMADIDLWEVVHGDRWWSVSFPDAAGPFIMNENLNAIKPDGRLGKNILHAVEKERKAGR